MFKLEALVDALTAYVEARLELAKAELRTEATKWATRAVLFLALFVLAVFAVLFLSIALAVALNLLLDSAWLGWLIVAVLYGTGAALLAHKVTNPAQLDVLAARVEHAMAAKTKAATASKQTDAVADPATPPTAP